MRPRVSRSISNSAPVCSADGVAPVSDDRVGPTSHSTDRKYRIQTVLDAPRTWTDRRCSPAAMVAEW